MPNADRAADDSFTIILQYDGEHRDLISTVKTTIVSPQPDQMKFWVRGTQGSFAKVRDRVILSRDTTDMLSSTAKTSK